MLRRAVLYPLPYSITLSRGLSDGFGKPMFASDNGKESPGRLEASSYIMRQRLLTPYIPIRSIA